jgi:hypothetical protein
MIEKDSHRNSSKHKSNPLEKEQNKSMNTTSNIENETSTGVCANSQVKESKPNTEATTPPNKDETLIWVSTTPHAPNEEGDNEEREGEENLEASKSPSFEKVIKKDSHPSPPLSCIVRL